MCFHATYLFSICGHFRVSAAPVKQCKVSLIRTTDAVGVASINAQTSVPSQDETVRLHQASTTCQRASLLLLDPTSSTESLDADGFDAPAKGNEQLGMISKTDQSECVVKYHPLSTYILPVQCQPCQQRRLKNIAQFEEKSQRSIWEGERQAGASKSAAGEAERRTIKRHSAARRKGNLIPLICVEELNIQRMDEQSNAKKAPLRATEKVMAMPESTRDDQDQQQFEIRTSVAMGQVSEDDHGVPVPAVLKDYPVARTALVCGETIRSLSWSSSWLNKSGVEQSTVVVEPLHKMPILTETNMSAAQRQGDIQVRPLQFYADQTNRKGCSEVQKHYYSAVPRANIVRDELGRNSKSIRAIMSWQQP